MAKAGALTPKQERFCRAYVANNGNGSKAAIVAGYSQDTARGTAYENLSKPAIAARIKALTTKSLARFEADADRITQELIIIGLANVADYMDVEEGKPVRVKPFEDMPPGATRAIKRIKERRTLVETRHSSDGQTETTYYDSVIELEFHSKESALALLAKKYGSLTPADPEADKGGINIHIHQATKETA